MRLDELVSRFEKSKRQSDGSFLVPCSSHKDRNPSLHISQSENTILMKCHAGCTTESICQSLGIELSDLFIESEGLSSPGPARKIVATYTYQDEEGKELYQVVRYDPKGFAQRHKNGKGEYVWNLEGVRRVLYHLPELPLADKIYLVEGEKDADCLISWGRIATTSAGGAQNWKPEYAESLKGKNAIILPDNDGPGKNYALQISKSLPDAKVILLPDGIKDVSDWLEAGNDIETLDSMIQDAHCLNPELPKITSKITGYIFKWPDFIVTVRRVDVHKAGNVTGDIIIEAGAVKLLPSTQFNFSAGRTRQELANDISTRDKKHEWHSIIQTVCDEVQT